MKAAIFDKDGVILDSETTNVDSAIIAFKKLNIPIKDKEKEWIIGRHPDDYKIQFLEKYNFSYDEFRKIQKKLYFQLYDSAPIFEETISLIKKLHAYNITLALTTSSGLNSTIQILNKAKINNLFNLLVTSEDYKKRKPDPEPYLVTAKKLKLESKDCVVFEDSYVGLKAAKAAGMKCVVIPNKYTKQQDFSAADLVIDSAKNINLEILNKI